MRTSWNPGRAGLLRRRGRWGSRLARAVQGPASAGTGPMASTRQGADRTTRRRASFHPEWGMGEFLLRQPPPKPAAASGARRITPEDLPARHRGRDHGLVARQRQAAQGSPGQSEGWAANSSAGAAEAGKLLVQITLGLVAIHIVFFEFTSCRQIVSAPFRCLDPVGFVVVERPD